MILSLCIPAYRSQIHTGLLFQSVMLVRAGIDSGSIVHTNAVDSCFLDLSRNSLLYAAVNKQNADWALFCDADTYHPDVRPIVGMLNHGAESGCAIVGAPVRLRGLERYNVQASDNRTEYMDESEFDGKVVPCQRIGTAFMAVNCRWLRERWPAEPWFLSRQLSREEKIAQNHDPDKPMKMSEDYEFCDEVRRRGGDIFVDGRFRPAHAGITSESAVWANVSAELERLDGVRLAG